MSDKLDEIEAFVIPILDDAFEKCSVEGVEIACCPMHLAATIQSALVKNLVRSIFADLYAQHQRAPTLDEMKEETKNVIILMREYYDKCLAAHNRGEFIEIKPALH